MFEKAEAEYETLTGKKRIVNNDKAKIEKVLPACTKRRRVVEGGVQRRGSRLGGGRGVEEYSVTIHGLTCG